MRFGSGLSSGGSAREATRQAALSAARALAGERPKLAIVFATVGYSDSAEIATTLRDLVGDIPIVGGTSACIYGAEQIATRGVSIVFLGGDDIEVDSRTVMTSSNELLEVVPAAEDVARSADAAASRGLGHYLCLVFAPGVFVDGEALVAAVRKGAGARAQLAGGFTSDDFTMDRAMVFAHGGELRSDRVVVAGLFTRRPVGIAALHGGRPVGPVRKVTRADGMFLARLDDRPAFDVWVEDALRAGAVLPDDPKARAFYLLDHYELGIADPGSRETSADGPPELLARAPFVVRPDGALRLSAAVPEGTLIRVLHATTDDLVRASSEAARSAAARAGGQLAGALLFSCAGRYNALGDLRPHEAALIRENVGAPLGGACVFGEIARNIRDSDGFFNMTAVVVAFPV